MPIITLTTDFGLKDHFVGALKGAIYSEIENIYSKNHWTIDFKSHETSKAI